LFSLGMLLLCCKLFLEMFMPETDFLWFLVIKFPRKIILQEWRYFFTGLLHCQYYLILPVWKGLICNKKEPILKDPMVEINSILPVFLFSRSMCSMGNKRLYGNYEEQYYCNIWNQTMKVLI
jgi:hypothetical protein